MGATILKQKALTMMSSARVAMGEFCTVGLHTLNKRVNRSSIRIPQIWGSQAYSNRLQKEKINASIREKGKKQVAVKDY